LEFGGDVRRTEGVLSSPVWIAKLLCNTEQISAIIKADAMYYRRKILLALIEVFGGSLQSTDCEKLLFNFCQQTGKNHYDFFPYKYGPFSFLSYYQ
jgi:hypothetical protein